MKEPIGQKYWAIAEGYIPALSHGKEPEMTSHETACLLNATEKEAHVQITADLMVKYGVGKMPSAPQAKDFVKLDLLQDAKKALGVK